MKNLRTFLLLCLVLGSSNLFSYKIVVVGPKDSDYGYVGGGKDCVANVLLTKEAMDGVFSHLRAQGKTEIEATGTYDRLYREGFSSCDAAYSNLPLEDKDGVLGRNSVDNNVLSNCRTNITRETIMGMVANEFASRYKGGYVLNDNAGSNTSSYFQAVEVKDSKVVGSAGPGGRCKVEIRCSIKIDDAQKASDKFFANYVNQEKDPNYPAFACRNKIVYRIRAKNQEANSSNSYCDLVPPTPSKDRQTVFWQSRS